MAASDGGGEITCANQLLSKGFVQVPILVLQDKTLGAGAKLTYGLLLWFHWTGEGYPGHCEAAAAFGISRASLCRYLVELEDRGLVEKRQGFQGNFNTYHLTDPNLILRPQESQIEILGVSVCDSHKVQDSLPLDSGSTRTESGDQVPTRPAPPAGGNSDSDLRELALRLATALGKPGEGKQLATWAKREGIGPDTLQAACERTQQRLLEEDVAKPVAYLQTVARQLTEARRQVAEVGRNREAEVLHWARGEARQLFANPVIGGSWRQVRAILSESIGEQAAAQVVSECEQAGQAKV